MKKRMLFVVTIASLIAFSSCEKCRPECKLEPAKIIRYDCDRVILQLLTSTPIGDSDWEDVVSGQRYSNIVSYYNTCKIAALTNGELSTIYVRINQSGNNSNMDNCYQCLAVSQNPPQTKVDFAEVSKSPCPDSAN